MIPAIAIFIASRQFYLSTFDTLSTWKGGGMGMFASSDNTLTRYIRVFVGPPNSQKYPVITFTMKQQRLRADGLYYPSRERFEEFARNLQSSTFVSQSLRAEIYKANEKGERIGSTGKSVYLLSSVGPRPKDDPLNWEVSIEYWNISYNTETRFAKAFKVDTYNYEILE
jgi:hypothetical protein